MSKIKVAALQIPTAAEKMENLNTVGTYLERLKEEKPDFVILPEMFCCPYQTENFPVYAEEEGASCMAATFFLCKAIWNLSDWRFHSGKRYGRKCLQYLLYF